MFKVSADQHQIIAGGGTTPYLADAAMLTALDGASLSATLKMARGGVHAAEGGPGRLVWSRPPHYAVNEGGELGNH